MAVAGIHHKDAQHARVTTLMGIEMADKAANIFTPNGESIQVSFLVQIILVCFANYSPFFL